MSLNAPVDAVESPPGLAARRDVFFERVVTEPAAGGMNSLYAFLLVGKEQRLLIHDDTACIP